MATRWTKVIGFCRRISMPYGRPSESMFAHMVLKEREAIARITEATIKDKSCVHLLVF